MGADEEERKKELQAANTIRRVIQRVRLATPETLEGLQNELLDTMEKQLVDLGSLYEKVQEESEKGLALATARVSQIMKKRATEEKDNARPRELIRELTDMVEAIKTPMQKLKEVACLEGKQELTVEDAPIVETQIAEFAAELQAFKKAVKEFIAGKGSEMMAPNLPPEQKKNWLEVAQRVHGCSQEAEATISKAKATATKVFAGIKSKLLEKMRIQVQEKIKDAAGVLSDAGREVGEAEKAVEPFFNKKKLTSEEDMLELAKAVDELVMAAKTSITTSRGMAHPSDKDAIATIIASAEDASLALLHGSGEDLKPDVHVLLATETKHHELKLGQLERRLGRITNIVSQYRAGIRKRTNLELVTKLKTELLEKAKGSGAAVAAIVPAFKEAEKQVEVCLKHSKMPLEEMTEVANKATEAIRVAKASMATARQQVCPIDESLDDDVKKQLRAIFAKEADLKQPELKLGQLERRLNRTVQILAQFEKEVAKKRAAKLGQVRSATLRIISLIRNTDGGGKATIEELFKKFDVDGNGSVGEVEYLGFFEKAHTTLQEIGTSKEGELVKPLPEDLKTLFAHHCQGADTITMDNFKKLVTSYMKVVKGTTLTQSFAIKDSKVLRQLEIGEILEIYDGPQEEAATGIQRVHVLAPSDGTIGWASVAGNAGTVFLKNCDPP